MKMTGLRPMLETKNVTQTIEFYTEVLGFNANAILRKEDGEPFWCNLEKDGVALMFNNGQMPMLNMTGSLYFNVENVDELWERLKDRTTVEYPIENFFYEMREFAIRDPNGYLLQFGQPINEAKT